jgi:hypothetical protein
VRNSDKVKNCLSNTENAFGVKEKSTLGEVEQPVVNWIRQQADKQNYQFAMLLI